MSSRKTLWEIFFEKYFVRFARLIFNLLKKIPASATFLRYYTNN